MKKRYLVLLAAVFMWAADCRKTDFDSGALEINFKGLFGAEPLMMYADDYPYAGDVRVKWQLFQFFLSDITLTGPDGKRVIKDADLVSFESVQSASAADEGFTLVIDKIPVGEYTGIEFGLGVSPELNKTKPADHSAREPLGSAANYWTDASSYIFTKLEGNADLNGDNNFADAKLTFHIGGEGGYNTRAFTQNISVEAGQNARVNFTVDLRKAIDDGQGNFINFRETTVNHGGNPEIAVFIQTHLLQNALELK